MEFQYRRNNTIQAIRDNLGARITVRNIDEAECVILSGVTPVEGVGQMIASYNHKTRSIRRRPEGMKVATFIIDTLDDMDQDQHDRTVGWYEDLLPLARIEVCEI